MIWKCAGHSLILQKHFKFEVLFCICPQTTVLSGLKVGVVKCIISEEERSIEYTLKMCQEKIEKTLQKKHIEPLKARLLEKV